MIDKIQKFHWTAVLIFFSASGAHGEEAIDAEGRALVDNFVENVRSMSGRFEQALVDADDIVLEESAGMLLIERPGRFRWTYHEPYEQLLIADGLNVWSYDVDLSQVTVKAQAKVLGSTPASLLGGSAEVLDDFEYVGTVKDRGTTWVHLQPLDQSGSFSKVELGFTEGDLSRMIFSDNLEQSTLIALFDVEINQAIDAGEFEFSPPAGVDLVGSPLVSDTSAK